MYSIKGRYASALLTIDNLDADAVSQLYSLLNAASSEGSSIAIMPDGHPGGSCLVGFTQRFLDDAETRIVPNFVGGDIACGIFAWPIGRDAPDLDKLDGFLRAKYLNRATRKIPSADSSAIPRRTFLALPMIDLPESDIECLARWCVASPPSCSLALWAAATTSSVSNVPKRPA